MSVTGVNFSDNLTVFTPVSIRLDTRTGPVLQDGIIPAATRINTTVTVPPATSAGDHVLLATQNRIADGTPKSGTPGRTVLRVTGTAGASTVPAASPWDVSKPGALSGSPATADAGDPALLGIALSLGLLTIGVTLVGRDRATRTRRPVQSA